MNKENQYVPGMMGCSDGGCIFEYKHPGTMVTNGGCQCQKELMRTEAGMNAYRTILWMRSNWPSMPFAGDSVSQAGQHVYPSTAMYQPERKHDSWVSKPGKVTMIRDVREACLHLGVSLREAKDTVDMFFDNTNNPASAAILYLENKYKPKGYCRMGDNCLCGGDTPGVQAGCFEWKPAHA